MSSSRLVESWNRYWFPQAPLLDLAILRIIAIGTQLALMLFDPRYGLASLAEVGAVPDAYYKPLPFFLPFVTLLGGHKFHRGRDAEYRNRHGHHRAFRIDRPVQPVQRVPVRAGLRDHSSLGAVAWRYPPSRSGDGGRAGVSGAVPLRGGALGRRASGAGGAGRAFASSCWRPIVKPNGPSCCCNGFSG